MSNPVAISETLPKLLYSKQEAMQILGVGEKTFRRLQIGYVEVGKRRKYARTDLERFIRRNQKDAACLDPGKGKGPRTTGTTSPSGVLDFEEARKQVLSKKRNR